MPAVEKEYDGQHKRHKVPQYLKPIHEVDFQGDTAKKTKKVWKENEKWNEAEWSYEQSRVAPIAMQMTETESAATMLDFAASYWLDSWLESRPEMMLFSYKMCQK